MPTKRANPAEIAKRLLRIEAIVIGNPTMLGPPGVLPVRGRGLAEKNELAYEKVQRALVKLRREGRISYRAIADGTAGKSGRRLFRR